MGAPSTFNIYDFPPAGDFVHIQYLHLLALVTRNAALTQTLFFFTTFLTTAIASNISARRLNVSSYNAIVVSMLFAFLPYHFMRNVQHLFLSSYFVLPLIPYVILEIIRPNQNQSRRKRFCKLAILGCLAGGTGIYYAIFSLLIVAIIVAAMMIREKNLFEILTRFSIYAGSALSLVALSVLPSFLYFSKNGSQGVRRTFGEVEFYGLKIANLFRPIVGHRLHLLDKFTNSFGPSPINGEATEMLGLIGSISLVLVLVTILATVLGVRRQGELVERNADSNLVPSIVLVAIFISTVGSINSIFYVFGLQQIRVWGRISPLIAFCCLVFAASFLQKTKYFCQKSLTWTRLGLMAAVLCIGLFDQTSSRYIPNYVDAKSTWASEEAFTRAADNSFAPKSMIYQYPNALFPENGPIVQMQDYAQAFPYIHGSDLMWSYGRIKTRSDEFHLKVRNLTGLELLTYLKQSGFVGVHVSREGIEDRGAELIAAAQSFGAKQIFTSPDDQEVMLDLRGLKATS
jgi:phosphoglycerol transferase